jgi:hypothetical protein
LPSSDRIAPRPWNAGSLRHPASFVGAVTMQLPCPVARASPGSAGDGARAPQTNRDAEMAPKRHALRGIRGGYAETFSKP